MIQRIFVLFLLSLAALVVFVPTSKAHFNVTDGTYDIEFHVEPGEKPVAGEKSTIYFTWNKTPDAFNWDDCICTLTIEKGGTVFYYTKLLNMRTDYVFPEAGTYKLTISGKPDELGKFDHFNLSYQYDVAPGKGPPVGNAVIFGALLLMFAGLVFSFILIFRKPLKRVFPFL
jgi:hypothetical protein